jgi:hypothetical protein
LTDNPAPASKVRSEDKIIQHNNLAMLLLERRRAGVGGLVDAPGDVPYSTIFLLAFA